MTEYSSAKLHHHHRMWIPGLFFKIFTVYVNQCTPHVGTANLWCSETTFQDCIRVLCKFWWRLLMKLCLENKIMIVLVFFFFNLHCNPCGFWPAQLSFEYSQQEGFYRLPLPAASQTPQLGGPVIRTFQLPPPGIPTSETTRANSSSGRWNYAREIAENFSESGDFHVTFGFLYMA